MVKTSPAPETASPRARRASRPRTRDSRAGGAFEHRLRRRLAHDLRRYGQALLHLRELLGADVSYRRRAGQAHGASTSRRSCCCSCFPVLPSRENTSNIAAARRHERRKLELAGQPRRSLQAGEEADAAEEQKHCERTQCAARSAGQPLRPHRALLCPAAHPPGGRRRRRVRHRRPTRPCQRPRAGAGGPTAPAPSQCPAYVQWF
eukprot:COSAG03_NODE_1040_length_4980_cov_23.177423_4_plen_205_part_00